MQIDLSKTSKELAYALLSQSANKTITDKDVSYGNINPITDPEEGAPNTTVELRSVEGSTVVKPGGTEPLVRKLTRYTLTEIATELAVSLIVDDDLSKYDTPSYVVAKVNELLGSVLTEEEVTVTKDSADNPNWVTVAVKPGAHIALWGQLVLVVNDNVDRRTTAEATFLDEELTGFNIEPDAPLAK